MTGRMYTVAEAAALIDTGKPLLVAADAALLAELPKGSWIGGSIPYFMTAEGGRSSRDEVYVDTLPEQVGEVSISLVSASDLASFPSQGYDDGFTVVILPFGSDAHLTYAARAPEFPGLFDRPVVGWVSGMHLDDPAGTAAVVVDGSTGTTSATDAVVLHAKLVGDAGAKADIVNLFTQGDGDVLTFSSTGFSHSEVLVNGEPRTFADYLKSIDFDTRLPLVADYMGAMVNVSVRAMNDDGSVDLYAPVFEGMEYKIAAPVADYVGEFESHLPADVAAPAFSCNCILNYLYSDLEGKKTGSIGGPITFGEIAYQLLNQTLVYLTVE